MVSQGLLMILYAALVEYGDAPNAAVALANSDVDTYYPFYQDVHVMIFIGFGFLMTFLKKYGFSSIGFNFLISCLAIQWALISNNLLHYIATAGTSDAHGFDKIKLGIVDLVKADFAAGCVLITFGAVLGKTSPLQMLAVTFFELIFYGINEAIGAGRLQVVDMGGSIFVHTFGAYFGLALSYAISRSTYKAGVKDTHFKNGSNKTSDMFAMIGTIFLWMFCKFSRGTYSYHNAKLDIHIFKYRVVVYDSSFRILHYLFSFFVSLFSSTSTHFVSSFAQGLHSMVLWPRRISSTVSLSTRSLHSVPRVSLPFSLSSSFRKKQNLIWLAFKTQRLREVWQSVHPVI